jgi:peptidoglycan-N-acetylglucosamine deacetylase
MFYFVKTPKWLQKVFYNYTWVKPNINNEIFLTFDDGPHPEHTPFVLEELKKYNAKATFFCIGKNVVLYPDVYERILAEGHSVGNHTHNHLRGRKTENSFYLKNVKEASNLIKSNLFRPPYGSIKKAQGKVLMSNKFNLKIIMWTVLSGDFDLNITKEKCLANVMRHTKSGSIVLFHDSDKAAEKMRYALPEFLKKFSNNEFNFCKLS